MPVEHDEWIEGVLGYQFGAASDGVEEEEVDVESESAELDELGVDKADLWESAMVAFEQATRQVDKQIAQLQAELRESDDVVLHDIADSGLNALTANTRVPLMAAIMEANSGGTDALAKAKPKLLRAVAAFKAQLASPEVQACDNKKFGDFNTSIEFTFSHALESIAYAAKMAA